MSDDLYAKDLLRWAADVSHAGQLDPHDASAVHINAMCGDRVRIDMTLDGGTVVECRHDTRACALTQGSAAILSAHASGETAQSITALAEAVAAMLRDGTPAPAGKWSAYGIFVAAAPQKSRHTCVLLPLEAAKKALNDRGS